MYKYISGIEYTNSPELIKDLISAASNLSGVLSQIGDAVLVFEFDCKYKAHSFTQAITDFYCPAKVAFAYSYIK